MDPSPVSAGYFVLTSKRFSPPLFVYVLELFIFCNIQFLLQSYKQLARTLKDNELLVYYSSLFLWSLFLSYHISLLTLLFSGKLWDFPNARESPSICRNKARGRLSGSLSLGRCASGLLVGDYLE